MNSPTTIPIFQWAGMQSLRRVYALNEHCLEVMAQLGRGATPFDAIDRYRTLWRNLDGVARKRAAACPILLVNAQFQSEEWWRAVRDTRSRYQHRVALPRYFSTRAAGKLMHEALMLAWSVVGTHRIEAGVLLGMTPAVIKIVAELAPRDVERIAARYSAYLQPRWMDVPQFWRKLLHAAITENEAMLHEVRLHSIQLLAGELIPILKNSTAH